jgi:putative flippase GtrA
MEEAKFLTEQDDKFLNLFRKYRLFLLYAIIGGVSASLDFAIFTVLTRFGAINYLIANVISTNCGILNSFLCNRHFNFKVKDKTLRRFLIFYSVGLLGLLVSSIFLWILIEKLSINTLVSKAITIVIITILQFSLNKFITFKTN